MDALVVEELVAGCCQVASSSRDSWQLLKKLFNSCSIVNQFFEPHDLVQSKFCKSTGERMKGCKNKYI